MEVPTATSSPYNATVPAAFPVLMLMMPFLKTENGTSGNFSKKSNTDGQAPETIFPSARALDQAEVGSLRAMNFLPAGPFMGGRQPMRANVPWGMWFWAFQVGRQRPPGGDPGQQQPPQQHPQMPQLLPPPGAVPPMPLPGPFPGHQMPPFMPPPQPQPQPQPPQQHPHQMNPIFPFAPFFPPMIPPMPIPQPPQPPVTEPYPPPSTPSEETEPPPTQTPEAPATSAATIVPTRFLFPNCGLTLHELTAKTASASEASASGSGMEPVARRRNQLRIVGGRDTPIDAIPWQVSLQRPRNYEMRHYCGGSVIHPQFILTAAHCLDW